nr:hypothetical protein [Hyphomonas sp. Mor2]
MVSKDALDLSQVDPPIWRIMVADIVYGPYTLGQMRGFVDEGRLTTGSSVSRGDGGAFREAGAYLDLAALFPHRMPPSKDDKPAPSNFLITVQSDPDGRRAVISVLNQSGRFSELMSGTFILNAEVTAYDLRTQLSTVLAERGKFVIVNADTGQLAWMGLGADTDQHARAIWKRGD